MSEYQVLARKYRPKRFSEVFGQDVIVTTLKNAIKFKRVAHAYLFCGSRGTGKTTLARIFAKALNCDNLGPDCEPCNQCPSCKEITSGASIDVVEIDGASNRGIDDVRQINETVGYVPAGKYKVYIIDEVHMLTKDAFNALLKTLEEPPAHVKFFFATTEAHKVLATILSRCQKFTLNRIPLEFIIKKLQYIASDMKLKVEEDALHLLAQMAEGGLRDAESLFDQIIAFHEGTITLESISSILGIMPRDCFFALDVAGKDGDFHKAFELAHTVFAQGKNFQYFIEGLINHFRNILLVKIGGKNASFLNLLEQDRERYEASAKLYTREQCINIIDKLVESEESFRFTPSPKILLETLLIGIIRSHKQIPVEMLVQRLSELEQHAHLLSKDKREQKDNPLQSEQLDKSYAKQTNPSPSPTSSSSSPSPLPSSSSKQIKDFQQLPTFIQELSTNSSASAPKDLVTKKETVSEKKVDEIPRIQEKIPEDLLVQKDLLVNVTVDPTPTHADLGKEVSKAVPAKESLISYANVPSPSFPVEVGSRLTEESKAEESKRKGRYDTLMYFAAVELAGTLQKKSFY